MLACFVELAKLTYNKMDEIIDGLRETQKGHGFNNQKPVA